MKPAKSKLNRGGNQRTKKAKRDDDVMNTNDSSIVSKRCVSKLYFGHEPDFYEPFVPKFVRRNPLINRGYWLRMHAIEQVVRRFLEEDNTKKKVIINLGCGYDPLPFQFWHRYESLTENAVFVDVDYPQLIEKKRDRMLTNSMLRDALLKTKLLPSQSPVYLRSEQYMAIGCDLRDLDILERTLRAELNMSNSSVLYVAEVSATYMPVVDSDRLIRWAATSFKDARFCILEQYLPQGPEHPFAKTMLAHFKKLQASIYAVERYLTLEQQSSRFLDAGWTKLDIARNLWDLWSDDTFTSPALRQKLDAIESFDEWEEYGCYAGHYFLVVASNVGLKDSGNISRLHPASRDVNAETIHLNLSVVSAEAGLTPRRFTAAFMLDRQSLAVYGGQGPQNRLSNLDVLRRQDQLSSIQPCTSPPPDARMCHTITPLHEGNSLLVGGRGSPSQAFSDCWLIDAGAWTRVDDIATARYRHSAVSVNAGNGESEHKAVLVFGGKASDGKVLDDWTMWSADGWHIMPVDGPRPSARFGAALSLIGSKDGVGLLIGGVGEGGTVMEDVWEWTFCATPTPRLTFKDRTNDICSALSSTEYARIGASLLPWGDDSLLLIGGVSKDGIHSLSEDFVLLTHSNARIDVQYPAVQLPSTWPLLVGNGVVALSRDEIAIAGGGAVCFSMGSFWNQGCLSVTKASKQGATMWQAVPSQISGTAPTIPPATSNAPRLGKSSKRGAKRVRSVVVPRVSLQMPEDFAELIHASKPAIIEGQDLGQCIDLWTTDYLKEKIGPEHELVVHECSSDRMTFKDKNFAYVKKTTSAFLDGIKNGSPEYLRAVSSTQPNKLPTRLEDDFPTIASDFHIPEIFEDVKANSHSSPLRISGPVSLWLHYDVLSNILCQIRGTKTLHLFPPSDVKHLSYPPGGSSSNIDIHSFKDPNLRFTHPHVATLKPGDILFIPPMWSHTATPQDGVSVAVNVFWRNLDKGYAAGKDVYGNRDLQAYENGRRDVEKIVRAFRDVPADISRFYLDRLAGEIQDASDKLAEKGRR